MPVFNLWPHAPFDHTTLKPHMTKTLKNPETMTRTSKKSPNKRTCPK